MLFFIVKHKALIFTLLCLLSVKAFSALPASFPKTCEGACHGGIDFTEANVNVAGRVSPGFPNSSNMYVKVTTGSMTDDWDNFLGASAVSARTDLFNWIVDIGEFDGDTVLNGDDNCIN
ncbi:MAG: hypothetical protein HRU20_10085, partial [Pseudomonadales bacterium]|nr:hypothetical protein [Pseudomonadales bacterium]